MRSSTTRGARRQSHSREVLQRTSRDNQLTSRSEGLEQQSDHSTGEVQAASLVFYPRLRANSGKQNGRDFNKRCGDRGRQPIRFRTHRPESRASGDELKTKIMEIRQKVDRNRAKWIRLGYEWFSRRTILPASEEMRHASCRKIAARP